MRFWARSAVCIVLGAGLLHGGTAAEASSVNITGAAFGTDGIGSFAGYGSSSSKNNVVGYAPSGLTDPFNGSQWRTQGNAHTSAAIANVPYYQIDWYLIGAESGYTNSLYFNGSLISTEHNQNNRLEAGNDPGPSFIGTTTGSGAGTPIPFTLADVTNGANAKPGAFIASLMFAYVEPVYDRHGVLKRWRVTGQQTDWFAFASNDSGSSDRDFDDFVGVAHVRAIDGPPLAPTPLPGALPLMASILGGGYLLNKWRNRHRQAEPTPNNSLI
jgi:hypothetical protein